MCTPRFLIPITDDLQPRVYPPSYEEVLLQNEYEDSSRLPTYQFRPLRRYHPYLRFTPPSSFEGPSLARYYVCDISCILQLFLILLWVQHTIYDDEYIHLDVPPLRTTVRSFNGTSNSHNSLRIPQPAVIVPPVAPSPTAAALAPAVQANGEAAAPRLEVDEARIQRLGDLIFVCRSELATIGH